MSKFLKIMIVLLTIAAVAAPVMAEDRLSLNGQMRVRGWYIDDGGDSTNSFIDQRLRIGGKFSIADGVSVTFRTDVTERTWGDGGSEYGSGRMPQDGMQWDRAHLDLDFGNVALRAGQQYVEFGKGLTVNTQEAGLKLTVKGAVPVTLFWMLDDDNTNDDDNDLTTADALDNREDADSYIYGANVGHKTDMYAANVFVASQTKALTSDEEVYVIGADATFNLEAVKLTAALDFFTGDYSDTVDAMGTQGMVDVAFTASEMATVGGQLYYALGADDDEFQYALLGNNFGGWDPLFDVGTGLSNEKLGLGTPYDMFGDNSGVMAGRLYANLKASDALGFGASVLYAEPESDDAHNTDADSAMALALGMTYKVMANTQFHAQLEYIDFDESGVDEITQAGVGLFVNF